MTHVCSSAQAAADSRPQTQSRRAHRVAQARARCRHDDRRQSDRWRHRRRTQVHVDRRRADHRPEPDIFRRTDDRSRLVHSHNDRRSHGRPGKVWPHGCEHDPSAELGDLRQVRQADADGARPHDLPEQGAPGCRLLCVDRLRVTAADEPGRLLHGNHEHRDQRSRRRQRRSARQAQVADGDRLQAQDRADAQLLREQRVQVRRRLRPS